MKNLKLFLHTCCAPCSTAVIERLIDNYNITLFFYNPNLYPEKEYYYRMEEFIKIANIYKLPYIIGPDHRNYWNFATLHLKNEPEGGRRCWLCFKIRLKATAMLASKLKFDVFTTTLTISPLKNAKIINNIGTKQGKIYNIKFLVENFKKKDGFKRSVELSKKYNLYRQNYCGCIYSLIEAQQRRRRKKIIINRKQN